MFCEMLGFLEHMAALLAAVLINGHGNSPTRHAPQAPPGASRALRGMMADKDRRWVREPASPESYASGVRLFAYKRRKRDLSCD